MPCIAACGMAGRRAAAGVPTSSAGASSAVASSSDTPTRHQTTAHIFLRCSSSGKSGTGGTVSVAKKPFTARGAAGRKSRYQRSTSGSCSIGHIVGPAITVDPTGCVRNWNSVTMPKFPPPPRSAQNSSGCSSALACTCVPSASTTSAPMQAVDVRPKRRERWPMPPPSVSPPTPVVEMTPDGRRAAVLARRRVDVGPRAAAADAHGLGRRVDDDVLHAAEVDDDRVVGDAEAAAVVAATADGDALVVCAGERERARDVLRARADDDQRRGAGRSCRCGRRGRRRSRRRRGRRCRRTARGGRGVRPRQGR